MPKLMHHADFRPCYPETFNVELVRNCPCMAELAVRLQNAISEDWLTENQSLIPGLREALRQLAAVAEV